MQKLFETTPDLAKYHDSEANFSTAPTLPALLANKEKTGGPLFTSLKYKSPNDPATTVDVKIPDLLPKMQSNRDNVLGVFDF